jgi:hypothetical protein
MQSTSRQHITADGSTMAKYKAECGTEQWRGQPYDVKHQVITFMQEYAGKSIEELRLEDYYSGRVSQVQLKKKLSFLRQKYNQSKQELQELQNHPIGKVSSELLRNYEKLKEIDGDIVLEFQDGKILKAHNAVLIGKFD